MARQQRQTFESSLLLLERRTHRCLLMLTGLLKKLPGSETVSHQATGTQTIHAALQVAVTKLTKVFPQEITTGGSSALLRQKEPVGSGLSLSLDQKFSKG